jgi:hypothetical protein
LVDATYTLTLRSGKVTDASSNTLASDFSTRFFALAGDVNGDGRVNSLDLLVLSHEIARPELARNLNDDLNGDGKVDLADLSLVRQHYLARIP